MGCNVFYRRCAANIHPFTFFLALQMKGHLPEELALLSTLSIVQLQNNDLAGTLPQQVWSSWEHLVYLNLQNNAFIGPLPDMSALANAKLLNTLSFRSNQLSGFIPTTIGMLGVEFLSLSGNKLAGPVPSELGQLSNTKDLYLYDNLLTGPIPTELGLLTKLTRLELHLNNLSGWVPKEVCDLNLNGNLATLTVDCEKVTCSCNCDCTATEDRFRPGTVFDIIGGKE